MPLTLEPGPRPGQTRTLPARPAGQSHVRARPRAAAAPYLGGIAFAAGRSVPELLRHLETAQRQARAEDDQGLARELASRAALLRALLAPDGFATLLRPSTAPEDGQASRFGHWLTRLQAAWYAREPAAALEAAHAAAALAGPRSSTGDLMLFHAFAVSAQAWWQDAAPFDELLRHCEALRYLDERCQASGGALHTLALAACERRRGNAIGALRGFEQAAAAAARLDLHWLAALGYEQAAMLAQDTGLAAATVHYRAQCQAHYRDWGARGRAGELQRGWDAVHGESRLGLALAHELSQPLAAICLHAAAAGKWLRRAEPDIGRALESLALIGAAGGQAAGIVRGLQRQASGQPAESAEVDVDAAVRATLLQLRHRLCEHGIEVELALGLTGRSIVANRVQLQQVLTNLLVNAIEAHAAAGLAGPRRILVASRPRSDKGIELSIGDNGPGIAACDRARLFTSAFSTKRGIAGNAAGMGLSICLAIVHAHGGKIRFEACEPHGARFRICLPPGPGQAPPR